MPEPQIERIAARLDQGEAIEPITVKELLRWFGAQRRGQRVVSIIREQLNKVGIETTPDFNETWLGGTITFRRRTALSEPARDAGEVDVSTGERNAADDTSGAALVLSWVSRDPSYRVSRLPSANKGVLTVSPDAPLETALTEMMRRDYSQLAVATSERDLKGIISWKSIAQRLALKKDGEHVRDFMEPAQEVRLEASIFEVIHLIVKHDYVIVRGSDRRMTGIVTASDLSVQFHALTEPFLLLSEIENLLRNMIGCRFTVQELQAVKDPNDDDREVADISDLTFGEYIILLENDERWDKLCLAVDRKRFCEMLHNVRTIRNGVMHFDPDPLGEDQLRDLQGLARFLKELDRLGVLSASVAHQ